LIEKAAVGKLRECKGDSSAHANRQWWMFW
jgi:hypothetical protein